MQSQPRSKVPEESQAEALLSRAFAVKHAKEIHPRVRASNTKLAVILSRKRYERIHRALEEKYPDARVNLEFVAHLHFENKGVMYASNRLPLQIQIARYLSADIKAEIERSFLPKPCKPLFGQIAWNSPWRYFHILEQSRGQVTRWLPDSQIYLLNNDEEAVPGLVIDVSIGATMAEAEAKAMQYLEKSAGRVRTAIAIRVRRAKRTSQEPPTPRPSVYLPCLDIDDEDNIRQGDIMTMSVAQFSNSDDTRSRSNSSPASRVPCWTMKNVEIFPKYTETAQQGIKLAWNDVTNKSWDDAKRERGQGQMEDLVGYVPHSACVH